MCLGRLDSLVKLKTDPQNADGHLLSDEEYARQRSALLEEKQRLDEMLDENSDRLAEGIALLDEVFEFTRQARAWLGTKPRRRNG
jgi:hypothetical protein